MPRSSAATFTGDFWISRPRPAGRSGCVTTPSTRNAGSPASATKEGTAKAGVPQKTIRSGGTGRLPLARFLHFADFALDQIALEHAEVIDKEDAIEMIDLVAEGACEQAFAAHFELFAVDILGANRHVL